MIGLRKSGVMELMLSMWDGCGWWCNINMYVCWGK